jgi:hypothetical protein
MEEQKLNKSAGKLLLLTVDKMDKCIIDSKKDCRNIKSKKWAELVEKFDGKSMDAWLEVERLNLKVQDECPHRYGDLCSAVNKDSKYFENDRKKEIDDIFRSL